MFMYMLFAMVVSTCASSAWTDSAPKPDLEGPPAAGLIQWGDKLRRLFDGTEEDGQDVDGPAEDSEASEKNLKELKTQPDLHQSAPDSPALLQFAKLNLHRDDSDLHKNHAHVELEREV